MPKGPLRRDRFTSIGPFVEDNEDVYDRVVRRLRRWGATDITDKEIFLSTGVIDFRAPFPGEHPIRSSMEISDTELKKGTVRYGSVNFSSRQHPTDDPSQLERLKKVALMQELPDASVVVNYGDTHRVPRPHLLVGWIPGVAEKEQIVQSSPDFPPTISVDDFMDLMVAFGKDLRDEFEGRWD